MFVVVKHHSCDYDMCGKYRCRDSYVVEVYGPYVSREDAENKRNELRDWNSSYWFYSIREVNEESN